MTCPSQSSRLNYPNNISHDAELAPFRPAGDRTWHRSVQDSDFVSAPENTTTNDDGDEVHQISKTSGAPSGCTRQHSRSNSLLLPSPRLQVGLFPVHDSVVH